MTSIRILICIFVICLMYVDHVSGVRFNALDLIAGCIFSGMIFWEFLVMPMPKEPIGQDNPDEQPQMTWREIDRHAQILLERLPRGFDFDTKIQIIEECRDQLNHAKEQDMYKDSY